MRRLKCHFAYGKKQTNPCEICLMLTIISQRTCSLHCMAQIDICDIKPCTNEKITKGLCLGCAKVTSKIQKIVAYPYEFTSLIIHISLKNIQNILE